MAELCSVENFIYALQKCRKKKDLAYAKRLHAHICSNGLEVHRAIGNHIVPMFVDCGCLTQAREVFERLVDRNEHSWTSLISGYIQCGQLQQAFKLYQEMQESGVNPTSFTVVPLIKAFATLKDIERGREIHVEITKKELEKDLVIGNTLISLYAKCGLLSEAHAILDNLQEKDVVSWNALIAGYVEYGQEALKIFYQMQLEGMIPDAVTFVCTLKACSSIGAIDKGREVWKDLAQMGFERYPLVENTLVDMYAKCGSLLEAQEVFNKLTVRDVVSWNALITGYTEHGSDQEALMCFQQMQLEGVSSNNVTLVCLLKLCRSMGTIDKGRDIHAETIKQELERECLVGSSLVGLYAKCGLLSEAHEIFDKLIIREIISWTALIAGYAEHGLGQEALKCFEQMQLEGMFPDVVTLIFALKSYGRIGAVDKVRQLHMEITQKGFESNPFIGNSLIDLYTKCGSLSEAWEIFGKLPERDVVSWNTLIAGYAEHGLGEEGLRCFKEMQVVGISPNGVTFICVLKACGSTKAIDMGREIHRQITQEGFERDPSVCNTLVDMFVKCGSFVEAQDIFDNLHVRDVVSWNALIAGYAEDGPNEEALKCFEQMELDHISPDAVTFVCLLKACGNMGAIDKGRRIHLEVTEKGFLVGSSLVDMYAKCCAFFEAWEVFEQLPVQDLVSWTALIVGYLEHGLGQEALKCFEQMQLEGVSPDAVTYSCILKACGSMGALDKSREIYSKITGRAIERNLSVGNTLIDMYAKCSALLEAQLIFDNLPVRDIISWTSLIAGYAMNHEDSMVLQCFENLREQGLKPSVVTFTCLLTACSHANLLYEGQEYFKLMIEDYGIEPTIDHYTCMVDLLARSGHLHEAEKFLESTPCPLSEEMWRALLSRCKTFGESELGLRCFQQLVHMNSEYSASYVLMADIYASAGRWDDVYRIEEMRKHAGAWKKPASALIEVNKQVHEFVVGGNESEEISAMLEILSLRMKEEGHVPSLDLVLRSSSD